MNNMPLDIESTISSSDNVLYIYPPSRYVNYGKVGIRPNLYNFNDDFKEGVNQEIFSEKRHGSILDRYRLNRYNYLTPQSNPDIIMDLRSLEMRYMFMLVLTHRQIPRDYQGFGVATPHGNVSKGIYYGFFTDEPVTRNNTVNPQARLIITHITEVKDFVKQNKFGTTHKLHTLKDESVITYDNLKSHLDAGYHSMEHEPFMYYLDPKLSVYSHNIDGNSYMDHNTQIDVPSEFSMMCNNSMNYTKRPVYHEDKFNNANTCVGQIVNNIKFAINEDIRGYDDFGRDLNDQLKNSFENGSFNRNTPANGYLLSADDPPSMYNLMQEYNPHIIRYEVNAPVAGDNPLVDTTQSTLHNVHYAMIISALTPIMNESGIARLTFNYDSYRHNQPLIIGSDTPGATLINVVSYSAMSDNERNWLATRIIKELIDGPFEIIENSVGDFTIDIDADMLASTTLRLQPYDMQSFNEVYTHTNSLSGITSPMIGTESTFRHNTEQLNNVIIDSVNGNYEPTDNYIESELPTRLLGYDRSLHADQDQAPSDSHDDASFLTRIERL